jgi:hypothetical protein
LWVRATTPLYFHKIYIAEVEIMSKGIRFETKKMQTAIAAVPAINEIVEKQTKKENKVIEPLTWEQLFLFFPVLDPILELTSSSR